jgi:hypothetical protein
MSNASTTAPNKETTMSKYEVSKYEVNANGNRTFSGKSKAAVMRVWKTWARLGFAPQAYEIADGERGIETRRIA